MDAKEYLGQRRDAYIEKYRELINTKHDEGAEPCAEVWVQPNVPPGEQGPAHPLCVDVMITRDGRQEIVMLTSEDAAEGPRVAVTRVGELDVNIYPLYWEVFPVWIAHKNPDWSVLKPWCEKWMDTSGNRDTDEYGLHGLVH